MNTPVATVVIDQCADESLRRALARSLCVNAQFAQSDRELIAASLLRQCAAVVMLGCGVVSLAAATKADIDAVVRTLSSADAAKNVELAAVLVELRPPQLAWAAALVAVWDKFMAASLALPRGAGPIPLDGDGGAS